MPRAASDARRAVSECFIMRIPDFVKYLGIAILTLAAVVAVVMWMNRGSHLRLDARVLKARLVPGGDESALAVLDVRVANPSEVLFVVREARLKVTLNDGSELTGDQVAQGDLDRVLDFLKIYGPRYNPVIKAKERFPGGTTSDRTVVGSFARSAAALEQRRGFLIEVEDVDGAIVRFAEGRAGRK
jgi:hypothetical protein